MESVATPVPERRPWPWPQPRPLVLAQIVLLALGVAAIAAGRPGVIPNAPAAYVVLTGPSMLPTLRTGDVALVTRQPSYRVGDIVAYRIPRPDLGGGLIVIHRIIGGDALRGYLVRGDNKRTADPWRPTPSEVVGRVRFVVPKLGLVVEFVHSTLGIALLAALVAFAVALGGGRSASPLRAQENRVAAEAKAPGAGLLHRTLALGLVSVVLTALVSLATH